VAESSLRPWYKPKPNDHGTLACSSTASALVAASAGSKMVMSEEARFGVACTSWRTLSTLAVTSATYLRLFR
jgi:hypothetical protein